MAILSDYTAGTVTVGAGGTAVTGVGTAWQTAGFQEGDLFIAADWYSVVASVNSNTSLTLYPVGRRGAALSGAPYRLRYMSDGSRSTAQARELINLIGGSGNLQAIGGLTSAPNTAPYFTGAGTAGVHNQSAFGRAIQALTGANGSFIRSTGANTAVMQSIVGTVTQSGGTPTGAIVERGSNANGQYVKFADGTQICWATVTLAYLTTVLLLTTWTFPAAFSAPPVVNHSIDPTSSVGYATSAAERAQWGGAFSTSFSTGLTGWNVQIARTIGAPDFASGNSVNTFVIAVGRWF